MRRSFILWLFVFLFFFFSCKQHVVKFDEGAAIVLSQLSDGHRQYTLEIDDITANTQKTVGLTNFIRGSLVFGAKQRIVGLATGQSYEFYNLNGELYKRLDDSLLGQLQGVCFDGNNGFLIGYTEVNQGLKVVFYDIFKQSIVYQVDVPEIYDFIPSTSFYAKGKSTYFVEALDTNNLSYLLSFDVKTHSWQAKRFAYQLFNVVFDDITNTVVGMSVDPSGQLQLLRLDPFTGQVFSKAQLQDIEQTKVYGAAIDSVEQYYITVGNLENTSKLLYLDISTAAIEKTRDIKIGAVEFCYWKEKQVY